MTNSPYSTRPRFNLVELTAWTHRNRVARSVYFAEQAVEPARRTIPCVCGVLFSTAQGLAVHRGQHCKAAS